MIIQLSSIFRAHK